MNLVELAIVATIVAAAISSVMGESLVPLAGDSRAGLHVLGAGTRVWHPAAGRSYAAVARRSISRLSKANARLFPIATYNAWFDRARLVVAAVEIVAGFHASSGHEPPRTR